MIQIPMICETCHRTETDPIMLDAEICGACGDFLSPLDVDYLREDREERKRLDREYE